MLFEQDGLTALMLSVLGGHHECTSIIVANDADIDAVNGVCAGCRCTFPGFEFAVIPVLLHLSMPTASRLVKQL